MKIFGGDENKVPLKKEVMLKCQCGSCPVQAESACSRPKLEKMMQMRASMISPSPESAQNIGMSLASNPMEKMDMKPEEIPGVYCSIGKAACDDLNMKKGCICNTCQVYEDYSLMKGTPVEHFCFNGKPT